MSKKPKTFCCECGDPIYDNVDATRDVVCDKCIFPIVVRGEEKSKEKTEKKASGKSLRQKRKELGWTVEIMAKYLRISKDRTYKMETDACPLNKMAKKFITEKEEHSVSEATRRHIISCGL